MDIKQISSSRSLPAAAAVLRGPARKWRWCVAEELARVPALEVELLLSTHLSVVVRACVEFVDTAGFLDTALVIARQHCDGDRPSGPALLHAARQCAARLSFGASNSRPQRVRRLQVYSDGHWLTVIDSEAAGAAISPLRPCLS